MAIPTDASVEFFGDWSNVTTNGGATAAGAISSVSNNTFTNTDNAIVGAYKFIGTLAGAPNAQASMAIIAQPVNVDTNDDQTPPATDFVHIVVATFPLDTISSQQKIMGELSFINIEDAQEYDFYIQNNTSQSLNSGWTLDVKGKAIGPKA